MELQSKGYLDDVTVDLENQRALTRFLDAGKWKSSSRRLISPSARP